MKNLLTVLKVLYFLATVVFIVWFLLSWADIVTHNTAFWEPDYACYQPWNFFTLWWN